MRDVIGHEGGAFSGYPMIWGASAIRVPGGIINAVTNFPPISESEWKKLVRKGSATEIEVPIPVTSTGPLFTVSLRLDLVRSPPYLLTGDEEWRAISPGVVGVGFGPTRAYYVFESHERLTSWLYHLHAGKFHLVPST